MSILSPVLPLPSGAQIPQIGLGTWPLDDGEAASAVETAIGLGYRHFDTAENYRNERGVGEGLRRSGLDRGEAFITTKFNKEWHSFDGVRRAADAALQRLGTDYVDLLLIHWPNPGQNRYVEAFRGMRAVQDDGLVRAIGVSNFKPAHLQQLADAGLVPEVNQVQLDPYHPRRDVREAHAGLGIVTEAWSPLGKGGELLNDPLITALAGKYGKTPAQIVLRWDLQSGIVTIPKSANPQRMAENLDIVGFTLEAEDMSSLDGLETGGPISDSDVFGH
ncbi:aldo/keto reductase [Arthrobacter sp. zg-Y820]|uniref:aldo/keto reductase n=1 Tax=unclassified Arthrobacter TaxID=235627 RepID=UPI001E5A645A|nr:MULTISPECIES: aldo/keto reductase [unclassified Arthrobacter]MCC9198436.1 aldo/keto reductase [Arthrobacter sp. zg-Y820]MDK1281306.1 aldo/keto reductase [Arthrobacter sp. zg.Y820]MDK1361795.1 aldo/keto reductase [Arthrobacter sp. zg-Y1219]WIB09940.1 aldo/keto reductase [Arthrobacter sp. zg-Y820]